MRQFTNGLLSNGKKLLFSLYFPPQKNHKKKKNKKYTMVVVAVIGSGMMGRGIAACCANGGSEVRMWDNNVAQIQSGVDAALDLDAFLRNAGVNGPVRGSVRGVTTLKDAVTGCDFVFEAVIEDVGIKNKVFREVEKHAPRGCVMATNTSSLSVTAIAEGLATPDRFVAAHFIGPAHLVPLVELCPARQSGPDAVPKVKRFLESMGKKPVVLEKEIQGFLAARLQAALYREAMHLVKEGVASPEAVDGAVTDGYVQRKMKKETF